LSSNSIAERAGRRNAQAFLRSQTVAGLCDAASTDALHRHDIRITLDKIRNISNEDIMRVAKWGNSLAVRLPKRLVDALSLTVGDELAIVDGTRQQLALAKDQRRKQALDNMRARRWKLPADYRFDREEANSR
jgi:antitoxin MazE